MKDSLRIEHLLSIFPFSNKKDIDNAILNGNQQGLFHIQINSAEHAYTYKNNIRQEILNV